MFAPVNVVIGGASGMGKSIAQVLAGRGELIVADINEVAATDVAREIGAKRSFASCVPKRSLGTSEHGRVGGEPCGSPA